MSPIWKWPRRRKSAQESTPQTFGQTTAATGKLYWTLTGSNGDTTLIVMCPDGQAFSFPIDHPNFTEAERLARVEKVKDAEQYRKLWNVEEAVRDLFGVVTDRVRVAEGIVYFDEKPIHNIVTDRLLQFMEEGTRDFAPLAKFMENIEANPNERCRNALFEWLEHNSLAIDEDGFVVCFKGVKNDYTPTRIGPGIVNGVEVKAGEYIKYAPGNLVSIPREKCDESNAHCSTGLHIANRAFAKNFSHSTRVMEVRVNPADVVSVALDGREKIRCCRLRVVGEAPPAEYFNKALRVGV